MRAPWTLVLLLMLAAALPALEVDPALPEYRPAPRLSGALACDAADAWWGLSSALAEAFVALHPAVDITFPSHGGAVTPAGLASGAFRVLALSRALRDDELAACTAAWGHPPLSVTVAGAAVVVIVPRDNPVAALSLTQLDGMFSATRTRGGPAVGTWGAAGLDGPWADRPIRLIGPNSANPAYGRFKTQVLLRGDFAGMAEQADTAAVVQAVAATRDGIGFALTVPADGTAPADGVRIVPLSADGPALVPDSAAVFAGTYPLALTLHLHVNRPPGPAGALVDEYLRYILSRDGQRIVARAGFYAVGAAQVAEALRAVR